MKKKSRDEHVYVLLTGERLSIGVLGESELSYLESLKLRADSGEDYFDLFREIRSPSSVVLADFGGIVTRGAVQSAFFRVASDIVDRAGIAQGRVLGASALKLDENKNITSVSEAAKKLGVSRQYIHVALRKGKILGWRLGSLWVVDLDSAIEYAVEYKKKIY